MWPALLQQSQEIWLNSFLVIEEDERAMSDETVSLIVSGFVLSMIFSPLGVVAIAGIFKYKWPVRVVAAGLELIICWLVMALVLSGTDWGYLVLCLATTAFSLLLIFLGHWLPDQPTGRKGMGEIMLGTARDSVEQ
jgi:hypothetical protein